jgi:hypothetical protein
LLTAEQINVARRLVGWSIAETARRAGISATAASLACRTGVPKAREHAAARIQAVMEMAGVEFFSDNGQSAARLSRGTEGSSTKLPQM